ncbi:hypothetical protein GEMRC1_005525 [Eukaryota sp. GEM-RC1]
MTVRCIPKFTISSSALQACFTTEPSITPESAWSSLQPAITSIFQQQPHSTHPDILYRLVQSFTTLPQSSNESLFSLLINSLQHHIYQSISPLVSCEDYDSLLVSTRLCWNTLCSNLSRIFDIFAPLDRSYVLKSHNSSLLQLCFTYVRSVFISLSISINSASSPLSEHLCHAVCNKVIQMREGADVDLAMMSSISNMMDKINLYDDLEALLLKTSINMFQNLAVVKRDQLDSDEYLNWVDSVMKFENLTFSDIFKKSTVASVIEIIESELFLKNLDVFSQDSFDQFVNSKNYSAISIFAALCTKAFQNDLLLSYFKNYILKKVRI